MCVCVCVCVCVCLLVFPASVYLATFPLQDVASVMIGLGTHNMHIIGPAHVSHCDSPKSLVSKECEYCQL